MTQHILLVSSDVNLYEGPCSPAFSLQQQVREVIVGDPSPELLEKIQQIIKEKNILGIVTRGSWLSFLKQRLAIPIFPLKIDAADVYRSLTYLASQNFRRIGIAIYSYAMESSGSSSSIDRYFLGNLELCVSHINSTHEIAYVIDRMVSTYNTEYILGDVEVIREAQKKSIPSSVITLDYRFLMDAIQQASYIIQLNEAERIQSDYVKTISNLISEAILSFGDDGVLITYNASAMAALKFPKEPFRTVQEATGYSPEVLLGLPTNKLLEIRDKHYIVNVITTIMQDRKMHTLIMNNTSYIQKIELSARMQSPKNGMTAKYRFSDIVAVDEKMVALVHVAKKYAQSTGTVLIRGETGTGKEMLASSIHNESSRRDGPFVALNCATLTENLVESELFGYEKGAFTGASSSGKKGLFELAHEGTIFLDEIGELPLNLQTKLLRVLQEREIMRIGGNRVIPVDVRVIAATNRDLHTMMQSGKFRKDLFYRLALLELNLPPLRERTKDIVPLFMTFLDRHMHRNGMHLFWKNQEVFQSLLAYDWPGNIRELDNLAERVVLLTDSLELDHKLIDALMSEKHLCSTQNSLAIPMTNDLRLLETQYIRLLLDRFGGDRGALCAYLNISRPTLWRKLNYTTVPADDMN